jgi:hypothetical protein
MQLETVKIDLGGGDWAVVYKDVLRVTARLHEAELRKHMTPVKVGKDGNGKVLLSELDRDAVIPQMDYLVDIPSLRESDEIINEIYIFNQVVEWSFGPFERADNHQLLNPEAIRETIDYKMTREQYRTLVQEMDRLYKPLPLGSGKPGGKV